MEPSIPKMSHVFVLNRNFTLETGDIIIYKMEDCPTRLGCEFASRIIGVPRDEIAIRSNQVVLNGKLLSEPYLDATSKSDQAALSRDYEVTVLSDNEYFILGDNRMYSIDSRMFGPISREQILTKVIYVP